MRASLVGLRRCKDVQGCSGRARTALCWCESQLMSGPLRDARFSELAKCAHGALRIDCRVHSMCVTVNVQYCSNRASYTSSGTTSTR